MNLKPITVVLALAALAGGAWLLSRPSEPPPAPPPPAEPPGPKTGRLRIEVAHNDARIFLGGQMVAQGVQSYDVPDLPPRTYDVAVEVPGMPTFRHKAEVTRGGVAVVRAPVPQPPPRDAGADGPGGHDLGR